jgi:hypothetical protein
MIVINDLRCGLNKRKQQNIRTAIATVNSYSSYNCDSNGSQITKRIQNSQSSQNIITVHATVAAVKVTAVTAYKGSK